MCLSAKSSCLGNILSICLEETAADVLRARAAVVRDAPLFRHWSFQTTRLLSLRRLHGALGFTDLAKKIPQDLAQLCISKPLRKTNLRKLVKPFPPVAQHSFSSTVIEMRSVQLSLPTPSNCRVYTTAQLHNSGPIRAQMLRDAVTSPGQTAAKLSHVPAVHWTRGGQNTEVSLGRYFRDNAQLQSPPWTLRRQTLINVKVCSVIMCESMTVEVYSTKWHSHFLCIYLMANKMICFGFN